MIAGEVLVGIGEGHRRFAQHVEAVGQPLLAFGRGAFQRLTDRAAKDELPAQDLHRLQGRLADHRFAQPADRALEAGTQSRCLVAPLVQHLAGQHQRKGCGVDESAAAFAHMFAPVDPGQLVVDQRIGGGRVGHPQQGLGQTHQRDAFVGAQAIGLQERIKPAGLVGPRAFDQPGGDSAGFRVGLSGGSGFLQALGDAQLLFHPVGQAQCGTIKGRRHGGALAPVADETNRLPTCQKTQVELTLLFVSGKDRLR